MFYNYRFCMIKRFFAFLCIGLFSTATFAFSSTPDFYYLDQTEQSSCANNQNNIALKNSDPGYYYFISGICDLNYIHDGQSFDGVTSLFYAAAKNKFPEAYFVLGAMYFEKYSIGDVVYAVKGVPNDLLLAINNYEIAAKLGSAVAANNLGENISRFR